MRKVSADDNLQCPNLSHNSEMRVVSRETMQLRHFFSILHRLSPVILANATVAALALLHNSRLNFHCYTQHEPTHAQKSAWKWQLRPFVTSCEKDYKRHSLMQTKGIHSCKPALLNCPILLMEKSKCRGNILECMQKLWGWMEPLQPTADFTMVTDLTL